MLVRLLTAPPSLLRRTTPHNFLLSRYSPDDYVLIRLLTAPPSLMRRTTPHIFTFTVLSGGLYVLVRVTYRPAEFVEKDDASRCLLSRYSPEDYLYVRAKCNLLIQAPSPPHPPPLHIHHVHL